MGDLGSFFGGLNLGDVGFGALVVLAIWLIFTGRLVPKSTVEDWKLQVEAAMSRSEGARRAALEEKKEWKEAYHLEREARLKLGDQVGELVEYAETAERFMKSITNGTGGSS